MTTRRVSKEISVTSISIEERLVALQKIWHWHLSRPGRLLLIRPRKPGDDYTEIGSNNWAADVKQKALNEGWTVTDLNANDATRQKIEDAINDENPDLIIHYDHGSNFTMWGQKNNNLEAGLDDLNIGLASGSIVSTVSCNTASGLGPTAIADGVVSYLGYTQPHSFWTGYENDFGQASNATNFALLECKTVQQAFDLGWAAYDQLYTQLLALGGFAASMVAPTALHDRDCFALLGSNSAVACPKQIHCLRNLPDAITVICRTGNPSIELHCTRGLPDSLVPQLCSANPDLLACGRGPDMCQAGPPLRIRDIIEDYPRDLVMIDVDKIPVAMRKSFNQMIERMGSER